MKKIFVYVSALALLLSSCSTTMSLENPVEFTEDQAPENLEQEDKWIVSTFNNVVKLATENLDN